MNLVQLDICTGDLLYNVRNTDWSAKEKKYSLDRQNWTTDYNFLHMYEHTYEEMVSAGVAERLPNL